MTNLKGHQYGIAYGLANKPELLVCEFRSACNWTERIKLVSHVFSTSDISEDRRPALSNEKAQTQQASSVLTVKVWQGQREAGAVMNLRHV